MEFGLLLNRLLNSSVRIVGNREDFTMITTKDIALMIDHSLLRPNLTVEEVVQGLELAKEYQTVSVCVRPCDISLACEVLKGSGVKVTTVIGFPHGSNTTSTKMFEAIDALDAGAVELDMVLNIGKLLSRDFDYVQNEIRQIAEIAHDKKALLKVILENCYLTDELIEKGCKLSEEAQADFVKTSTGFGSGGATISDLILMRKSCTSKVQIKAAGGVRTLDAALEVRRVGVTRFGATATKEILEESKRREAEGRLRE